MNVTLQVPVPTGGVAPTTTQLAAAVVQATNSILAGTQPIGVSLDTFSSEVVAYRPGDNIVIATAMSQAIVAEFGVPSSNPASSISKLSEVVGALARTQPSLIDGITTAIFTKAASDVGVVLGVPELAAKAISFLPEGSNLARNIVGNGLLSISGSGLSAPAKESLFIDPTTGFVKTVLADPAALNNPTLIQDLVQGLTMSGFLGMVPPTTDTSLQRIVKAAVAALTAPSNYELGAVAIGALRSQGVSASDIASAIGNTYTTSLVSGYINGTAALYAGFVAGKVDADAIAAGAVVRGQVSPSVIVQKALATGASPSPKDVVQAVVSANPAAYSTVLTGAISSGGVPAGGTLANVTEGAVSGAYLKNAGDIVAAIVQRVRVGAGNAVIIANVGGIIEAAIVGADATGKEAGYADIVNKAVSITRYVPNGSDPVVRQAIISIAAAGGDNYIVAAAAMAGDLNRTRQAEIYAAAFTPVTGQYAITGGDLTAATAGFDTVVGVLQNLTNGKAYSETLSQFHTAAINGSSTNSVIASLYGAMLANSSQASATLAAAIKQSDVDSASLTDIALNAAGGIASVSADVLTLVGEVAAHAKSNALTASNNDILDYVGAKIVTNPSMAKEVATAWIVVDPDHAHWVSHAVGFNTPTTANVVVPSLFAYAQITSPAPYATPDAGNPTTDALTSKAFPGTKGAIIDQPAAAAAIVAGITTGILEANLGTTAEKNALVSTITAAVVASVRQEGVLLLGPTNPFNGADAALKFRQSSGVSTTSIKSGTVRTVGAAGAITGYVAQVTKVGDSTISDTTKAVLTAASGGAIRPYALEIAQAAAQALRWVAGNSVVASLTQVAGNPVYDIANAIAPSVVGYATLASLMNAAYFGITEADNGTIGAGALGLNATGLSDGSLSVKASGNDFGDFYKHHSATGDPVTNFYNL